MKSPPAARRDLDEVIVNIELTLASIVQGLALSFLADNAATVLAKGLATAWPYVAVAFLIILLFWSRALIHTLTLIRWPLEFVHNFFYFACALVEVLAFKHLADPFMWFMLNAVFAALVWALFVHDLRIIRQRKRDSVGENSSRLYAIVLADQWANIRYVVPGVFLFSLGSALAIKWAPDLFIRRHGHLLLVGVQLIGFLFNLGLIIRSFSRITPLISATRAEWKDDVEEAI
ncbi:MAG TPA: hypothetical protein VM940_15650 [Chthoniobacterales bacterium]|nr:hypothetical protein [Chthoniobacterales bacterium]